MQQGLKSLRKFSSPFGVTLSNRDFTSESYRYGFNGMERDDEAKGAGNSYDFGARIYDNRLGRWLAIDKLVHKSPSINGYNFVANSPLKYIDINGEWIATVEYDGDNKSYYLKFTAEEGDNMATLSKQLGIEVETIESGMTEGEAQIEITTGTSITLGQLKEVQEINKAINNANKEQETYNCAKFAADCNGEKIGNYNDIQSSYLITTGGNLQEMESLLKSEFVSVPEESTKIGSIVRYELGDAQMAKASIAKYEVDIFSMTDDEKVNFYCDYLGLNESEKNSLVSNGASYQTALKAVNNMKESLEREQFRDEERHYSIVILKNQDGTKIQGIVQKHGPSKMSNAVESTPDTPELDYDETPQTTGGTPFFNKKQE